MCAGDDVDNYQCHIWIDNKTSERLTLTKHETVWGEFREGPLEEIARMSTTGKKAWRATGTRFTPGGVEGVVHYRVGETDGQVLKVRFDVPARPLSSNTLGIEVPDGFECRQTGWSDSGSTGSATLTLTRTA